jgi:hypothetical protein
VAKIQACPEPSHLLLLLNGSGSVQETKKEKVGSVNGASRDRKKARERKKRDPKEKRLKNERNGGNY